MTDLLRRAWWYSLFIILSASLSVLEAADKRSASLLVKDSLTASRESATVEAKLVERGLLNEVGLGGELLELVIDGKVVATSMTGGDGRAFLAYTPKASGMILVEVRVGSSSRVSPTSGQANLAVWERRNPIAVIELAALVDEQRSPGQLPAIGLTFDAERKPMPDAAEELGKLTKFYYRVIYVVPSSTTGADGFQASARARDWLRTHKFPPGYVAVLPSGEGAMGAKIDELHAGGWKTIKTGIGRTNAFADAFLQRRLEAVIVPEPTQGEAPRKAKIAKTWKDVRKKL
jgi:hypothetical protein